MLEMITNFFRRNAASGAGHNVWIESGGRKTAAGETINHNSALNYSAVFCATRIITEGVAMLPLILYEVLPDGGRRRATDHRWYDVVKSQPNPEMGSMAFREGRTAHQVNWGQGFAEIADTGIGRPALWPIHPSRVRGDRARQSFHHVRASGQTVEVPKDTPYYCVRGDGGHEDILLMDEMLHVPGAVSEDGIWGRGVIPHAKESIGFGLATEKHGAEYFGNGAAPAVIVKTGGIADAGKRNEARTEWKKVYGKPGEVAFVSKDTDITTLDINNETSQFLETRQHNITEISRWYRVPPHMLGDLSRATFSNIEAQGIDFVIYSLMSWLKRWEEQLNLKLLTPEERSRFYFEHNVDALLRGDQTARYNAYKIALQYGFKNINEVRRLENDNPIGEAGDLYLVPLNMTTIERMQNGELPSNITINQGKDDDEKSTQGDDVQRVDVRSLLPTNKPALAIPTPTALPVASLDVLKPMLTDVLRRMATKEANAIKTAYRQSSGDGKFLAFYDKHRSTVAEAFGCVEETAKTLGLSFSASKAADCVVSVGYARTIAATNAGAEVLQAHLDELPTTAEATAEAILNGENKNA